MGGAAGDALGAAVEFWSWTEIKEKFGKTGIQSFQKVYGRTGAITDDTQMALFTAEALLNAHERFVHRGITSIKDSARYSYLRWLGTQGIKTAEQHPQLYMGWLWQQKDLHHRRGPGNTCLEALKTHLKAFEDPSFSIPEKLNNSKGCGGVMRTAPAGLINLTDPFQAGCNLALITHHHPSGYLSAGFLAFLIDKLMKNTPLEQALEQSIKKITEYPHREEVVTKITQALKLSETSLSPIEALGKIGPGWVAEEALGVAVYCSLKADNYLQGIQMAVNHGGDSDSTGSITGNILGVIHGLESIPHEFKNQLELKDVILESAEKITQANKL